MPTQDLLNYYKRWAALDDLIRSAYETYRTAQPFPRQGAIVDLLGSLREFGAGQFQFFYYGFDPIHPPRSQDDWPLEVQDEFPPEDILVAIILQMGHDLGLIQQIAEQRRSTNPVITAALEAADKLAWLALQPATSHGIVDQPEIVITYFEKASGYYSIPYKKVAVIAVPFTSTMKDNHEDYLAIPHEVGHYVYRHLLPGPKQALQAAALANQIPAISERHMNWIRKVFEEMCADIYGCLVAGPVMAIDFQKLELENSKANLVEGDKDHPNGALRPLIYCQVLGNPLVRDLTLEDWKPVGRKLANRWIQKMSDRNVETFDDPETTTEANGQVTQIHRYNIVDNLRPIIQPNAQGGHGRLGNVINLVIEAISLFLKTSGQSPTPHDLPGWAGEIDAYTRPDDLFRNFGKWYVKMLPRIGLPGEPAVGGLPLDPHLPSVPPFPADAALPKSSLVGDENDHTPLLWRTWVQAKNPGFNLQPQPGVEILAGEVRNSANMNPGEWGYILWAEGWTTEGPSNSHMPPLI